FDHGGRGGRRRHGAVLLPARRAENQRRHRRVPRAARPRLARRPRGQYRSRRQGERPGERLRSALARGRTLGVSGERSRRPSHSELLVQPRIHPLATIDSRAKIAADAEIGPYCVIEGEVSIGSGTIVESHARIGSRFGRVVIGERNRIQAGAVLGGPPQDLSYEGGYTELAIGDDNRIGEYVSVSLGSVKGGGVTRIGNRN